MATGGYLQGMQTFCVNKDLPDSTAISTNAQHCIDNMPGATRYSQLFLAAQL